MNRSADQKCIVFSIARLLKREKAKKILDVGCGSGWLVKDLKTDGFEAFGCDLSGKTIRIVKNDREIGHFVQKASAIKLPYPDSSFDALLAISVIEHLTQAEAQKFLREASRVLKSHGWIFLVTPNKITPLRLIYLITGQKWPALKDPTHVNFYTPCSLKSLLAQFSFDHFQFTFTSSPGISLDWEISRLLPVRPKILGDFLSYLIISVAPFYYFRNSFWLAARKTN